MPRIPLPGACRLAGRPSRLTLRAAAAVATAAAATVSLAVSATPAQAAGHASLTSADWALPAAGHASGPRPVLSRPVAARPRVSSHRAARRRGRPVRPPAAPARPYLIYDSVKPASIPAGQVVATYATGGYAVSPDQVAGRAKVIWIDTAGTDPTASVVDVEPGTATPAAAASWTWRRLHAEPGALARIYTMRSEWPAVQAAVAGLPAWMRARIRWWIADPTGAAHLVPGSDATQWYWGSGYDITTATPRF